MFTTPKLIRFGLLAAVLLSLAACASQAPRISNAALGYAVTSYAVSADSDENNLSGALGAALNGAGIATAMPANAAIKIDFVRYDSPIIGLFYGGQHYSSLSVTLTDSSGARIANFPVYVSANGGRSSADADLASKASQIIAAKAANAFMPIKARPTTTPKVVVAPVVPAVQTVEPKVDEEAPCVIGPDGKCLAL
jgi:hypothetical protein